ncbi:hypothetical protein MN869_05525 [Acinetobacter sp. NIPH1876]|uniref:YqiA/YcfP family alpha/beta fold hydrolase n=1 Tax=unclassified Acinetobacter TaxID=196816 RepID=UPI001FAC75CB|nr:YqiA/YcfP family alpha/beta fold hydrolase [Acinetobacter sp. NIPH1876]MCJ0827917.1 hypothetical protein [Acinetobacter sp. NIPH1876]
MFCITQTVENNQVKVTSTAKLQGIPFTYAFYVYKDGERIEKKMYTSDNQFSINTEGFYGNLQFQCFFKNMKTAEVTVVNADTISFPRKKITLSDLDLSVDLNADIQTKCGDIPVNFIKKDSRKLVVFLNAALALDAQKKHYPYFNRISYHKDLDCNCLYLYDISLNMADNYTIGWYRGTTENKLNDTYVEIINKVIADLGIKNKDVVLYGSSAGGFAAMKFAEKINGVTAVAINPQVEISKFIDKNAVAKFENIFDVNSYKDDTIINPKNLGKSKVIYVQNTQDTDHYENHFKPFWSKISRKLSGYDQKYHNYALIYDHESGHGGETPEVFDEIKKLAFM